MKELILNSKNIYLIPGDNYEAISCSLALFYSLKEIGKNVNLIVESLPENLQFLSPSLDFVSYPKNFVISVPEAVAKISQIYYEKSQDNLKIHLTLDSGNIKKDNVAFYFSEVKPDLIITVGVQDYIKTLTSKLDQYAFLLDSPILDIDNSPENKNFGKINIIEQKPLAQLVLPLINSLPQNISACLLTALVIYTDNFKKNITADVFELASKLMKNGADLEQITKIIK
jgi:nanoRNase/pAp phosphatase (c-di-AMP/oligoRNAs hydrolase)